MRPVSLLVGAGWAVQEQVVRRAIDARKRPNVHREGRCRPSCAAARSTRPARRISVRAQIAAGRRRPSRYQCQSLERCARCGSGFQTNATAELGSRCCAYVDLLGAEPAVMATGRNSASSAGFSEASIRGVVPLHRCRRVASAVDLGSSPIQSLRLQWGRCQTSELQAPARPRGHHRAASGANGKRMPRPCSRISGRRGETRKASPRCSSVSRLRSSSSWLRRKLTPLPPQAAHRRGQGFDERLRVAASQRQPQTRVE